MTEINEIDKQKLIVWLQSLNITELDLQKVITAFTHPSYKGMVPNVADYERFEFLGDAVLELISAEDLVRTSQLSEGAMTEQRKQLVNNDALSQVFDRLKIQPFIRTAMNFTPSVKDKANFVEALFGVLYLDKGYMVCQALWQNIRAQMGNYSHINAHLASHPSSSQSQIQVQDGDGQQAKFHLLYENLGLVLKNAKSMLQELCQKQNLPLPTYESIGRSGPDHDPVFVIEIRASLFADQPTTIFTAQGLGKSKKIAEIKAAETLCRAIFLEFVPS